MTRVRLRYTDPAGREWTLRPEADSPGLAWCAEALGGSVRVLARDCGTVIRALSLTGRVVPSDPGCSVTLPAVLASTRKH